MLWVQRFRCAACNKVFSLFLPTLYKWQRAEHDVQQEIAMGQVFQREKLLTAFSERTLIRWKQKWLAWSALYLQAIIHWLITAYVFLSVDVTKTQAKTTLNYVQALLAQLPGKAPSAVDVISVCRFGGSSLWNIPHSLSLVFL